VTPDEYRRPEADRDATHDFDTWDRICRLYGWPQTFASGSWSPSGASEKLLGEQPGVNV
jgi:hypothetical protein